MQICELVYIKCQTQFYTYELTILRWKNDQEKAIQNGGQELPFLNFPQQINSILI